MLNDPRAVKLNRKLLRAIVRQKPRKEAKIRRKLLKHLARNHIE
jgi:hypothetical protein